MTNFLSLAEQRSDTTLGPLFLAEFHFFAYQNRKCWLQTRPRTGPGAALVGKKGVEMCLNAFIPQENQTKLS